MSCCDNETVTWESYLRGRVADLERELSRAQSIAARWQAAYHVADGDRDELEQTVRSFRHENAMLKEERDELLEAAKYMQRELWEFSLVKDSVAIDDERTRDTIEAVEKAWVVLGEAIAKAEGVKPE